MFHHRSEVDKKPRQKRAGSAKAANRDSIKKVNTGAPSKQDRLNALQQTRQAKKEDLLQRRRLGAAAEDRHPPPKVVALVAFHAQADALALKRRALAACGCGEEAAAAVGAHEASASLLPPWAQGSTKGAGKQRMLFIDPPRDVMAVLDVVKCADVVVCVLGAGASLEEPAFDEQGYRLLSALRAQGMPSVVGAVCGGGDAGMLSAKKAAAGRKFVERYFTSEFAEARLCSAGSEEEVKALVRALSSTTPKDLAWRSDRGYLMAQEASYSDADGVLCLRGYLRGPGLRCKHLVHLTGHGDFSVARVVALPDPCPAQAERRGADVVLAGERVLDELRPEDAPDRQVLQPYDPTTEEQTWPTSEELGSAAKSSRRRGAAAIPAPMDAEGEALGDKGDADMAVSDDEEGGSAASDSEASIGHATALQTEDGWDVNSNITGANLEPNAEMVAAEKRRREVLLNARNEEELEFPDEVDTPLDVPAKERFQKYRGLKSFRTSDWDPYEELPVEYSRIWEFEAFAQTGRAMRQRYIEECSELEDGGAAGLYCAVYVNAVPPSVWQAQPKGVPFVASVLLPMEQKVSVLQGTVTRHRDCTTYIKSKSELTLQCGFRRFQAKPTFSEIPKKSSSCVKYKFSRSLHQELPTAATFYAPVVFPPSRLLMLTPGESGPELVAAGSVKGADPKMLVIKRIIITGYPFRTHKSKGVVRFMFFNPNDIRWFKPVELTTKKGLRGHIGESLGTHGYMKCRFSAPIRQDDTVCMNLYKRVYPKWFPPAWGGRPDETPEAA